MNSLLKPGFLLFSGSHDIECTHLQGVYRLGQAGLACTVGKDEVVASYFHFINRKAAGREAEPGLSTPAVSLEIEKAWSFLPIGGAT